MQHADRQAFEIHLFPLAGARDWMTGYLSNVVDQCHPHVTGIEEAIKQIQDAELDILVYPDVGMNSTSLRLAAQRLAPIQCAAFGHPVSTGLPSIDYFLSCNAMEPGDAGDHYTERLITLPGAGVCMPMPAQPAHRKTREDFGLSPNAVVYLSAQSLFKYLPAYDPLYARIAMEVEDAVFVFAEGEYPAWTRTFRDRLHHCFNSLGLDPERHVRFVPQQSFDDFLCLNYASDVFLDTIGWSGGMTAFDALSCDLPMVVLPGTLMRGRQSYGMLQQMGIEDTIASDVDDYVRIAVKLGLDREWRNDVSRRIRERRHLLFDDTRCVKSLEAFYRWAAGTPQPGDDARFKLWPRHETDAERPASP
ncbi:MAG: hypothetical protein KDI69_01665 [Xanthomonadales bacterium]|nr:hypothetical protein [Xanthomonadales bacterium]